MSGINPILTGINPFSPGINPILTGINPFSSGINPILTGINPFRPESIPFAPEPYSEIGINMPTLDLQPIAMDALDVGVAPEQTAWLWDGYISRGDVTLLTSEWKTGKTTMLCGFLQNFGTGTPFLGRATRAGKAWVVSEESVAVWRERLTLMPVGPHVQLLARPFPARPTAEQWHQLIDQASEAHTAGTLDLLVIDPLASFLPGRCESDAGTLLEALQPLHRLTERGVAVVLLHHPRKNAKEAGSLARGSGALLGFVDTSLELTRYSTAKADENRRLLGARSRRIGTPGRMAFEWNPATGAFIEVAHPTSRAFEENWNRVKTLLTGRKGGITPRDIREFWPTDSECPGISRLYEWLTQAFEKKLVRREGRGTRNDPWRFRLENADDAYYDRGELPPIRFE